MVFFIFIQIFIEHSVSKQPVETLIRHHVFAASDLGLYCLPMSHKEDTGLIWVKE